MNNNGLIVYIIGTTAAGKTNLSLNLGIDNYEIISCDSMQIYKEANIMTAKATAAEQAIKKHHGIDLLDLESEGFNRKQWKNMAIQKIEELQSRGKIPVLVGGTHYYIESILFNQENEEKQIIQAAELNLNGKEPYEYLKEIDPLAAEKFHPNDLRRINNSIKYYQNTGQLPSEQIDHHSDECKLRSNNFLILWPKWKKSEDLKKKVTERIHEMLDQGGTEEILRIFERLGNNQNAVGGILQSIGYKQFEKVYQYYKESGLQFPNVDDKFRELLNEGAEKLINDTMAYTKKQQQWIKNRILCNSKIDIIANRLFLLEFESTQTFKQQVVNQAEKIYNLFCQLFQQGQLEDEQFKISAQNLENIAIISPEKIEKYKATQKLKQRNNWKKQECQLCNKKMNGPYEIEQHFKSRYHRINLLKEAQLQKKKQKID
uniref:tRNA dimethylallyltransferase n=1 Tax=Paramecium tetraurelia TaxID=5888 RepID=Q3SE35_PARTE|nr:Putative tRNA delta(2)-isopentenylpyrophosphate transferase [Paramecium tetraurelia]